MSYLLDLGLSKQQLAEAIANDKRAGFVIPRDPLAGFVAMPPRMFQAKAGCRRKFLSQADADAYDRGYANYPAVPMHLPSPEWDGYCDREQHDLEAA